MNEARIKKLASEGKIEFSKKMLRRFFKLKIPMQEILRELSRSSVVDEEVFSSPDFTFTLRDTSGETHMDYVCVQSPDGRTLRVVGCMNKKKKPSTRK
jgi:hypothetical protein